MNGTTLIYNETEQAVLPLAGLVLSPLISLLVYGIARYRSASSRASLSSKAFLFYRLISGALFGQILSLFYRSYAEHQNILFLILFTALGYFLFDTAEEIGRAWTFNPHLSSPSDYADFQDQDMNLKTGEEETSTVCQDIGGPGMAKHVTENHDKMKLKRKRLWMLASVLFIFFMNSFITGLRLIYRLPTTQMQVIDIFICYYVNALTLSFVIYGVMIHAKLHAREGTRRRLIIWALLTLLWSVIFFISSLLVLIHMEWSVAAMILEHPATNVFYGLAAGILWKLQMYFHNMKIDDASNCGERVGGRILFFIAMAQAVVTNIWL